VSSTTPKSTTPADAIKKAAAAKNDVLLSEQTVSNQMQRQADWAIIRDMAHYLWPKNDFSTRFRVGLSVGLLVGAKV
jgi:ABC transporter ATM